MTINSEKTEEAERVIRVCIGNNGIWAGGKRYKYQCWTRDFIVSLPTLLDLGHKDICRRHFISILKNQSRSGEIPVLFADSWIKLFFKKFSDAIIKKRLSFVLKKMIWPGLSKLSPGTRDVDALFVLGVLYYSDVTGDKQILTKYKKQIDKAISYIENNLLDKNGLLQGADWRDMLEDKLKDKTLLSNNAILYEMYKKLGELEKSENIKRQINNLFWNGLYYKDYPDSKDFDVYGQSLAVLYDIVPPERYSAIVKKYKDMSMPFGFRINDIFPKPTTPEEKESVNKIIKTTNQFGVVWPYINAFSIIALNKMNEKELADKQRETWNKLKGFYEWYDPETGEGFGDPGQLWSATLYLQLDRQLKIL